MTGVDDALMAVPLFAGVSRERLHRLASRSTVRRVAAGTVVAVRGEVADRLIIVEAGSLLAMHETAGGQRLQLGVFPAPSAVDKSAVLDGGGYTATWVAAARTVLRFVPAREVVALLEDVPAARRHVLAHLCAQLRGRQDALVRAHFVGTAGRTAEWLLRAASRAGTRVVLPGAQQGLAEAVGASRVSVNRALRTLARDGLIRIEPGVVVVLAPELLALRAREG